MPCADLCSHLPQVVFPTKTLGFCVLRHLLITCIVLEDQAVVGGSWWKLVKGRFSSFNLNTVLMCWEAVEAPRLSLDQPHGLVLQLDLWCHVMTVPYVMCVSSLALRGNNALF